jgi:hypothetical protein
MERSRKKLGTVLLRILVAMTIACAGCSLFRGPTPQQQLYEALNRGDSAQASQIWLNMSAADKTKWMQGQGLASGASSADLSKQIAEHYQNRATNPEGGSQSVEVGNPSIGGTGLQQLKGLTAPPPPPSGSTSGAAVGSGPE